MIIIKRCEWNDIKNDVTSYYENNNITVDSYWEDHVLGSNHYKIAWADETVGFFSIYGKTKITLFHMEDKYANYGQEVFAKIKQYEQVTHAFLPTGDEFFLSHCIDNFARFEKQAYFSIYTDKPLKESYQHDLEFVEVKTDEDIKLLELAGDFFSEEMLKMTAEKAEHYITYLVKDNDELIGFGVIEYGRVKPSIGSAGMFVMEEKRRRGYAACILKGLQKIIEDKGLKAHSGCWYYNHNSKKSMESAGAFSKTRLINFYF